MGCYCWTARWGKVRGTKKKSPPWYEVVWSWKQASAHRSQSEAMLGEDTSAWVRSNQVPFLSKSRRECRVQTRSVMLIWKYETALLYQAHNQKIILSCNQLAARMLFMSIPRIGLQLITWLLLSPRLSYCTVRTSYECMLCVSCDPKDEKVHVRFF